MQPEEKHGPSMFYQRLDNDEMVQIDAVVTEIKLAPSYELMSIDWGLSSVSITGIFAHNIRTLSPELAILFKRVSALGYVYI